MRKYVHCFIIAAALLSLCSCSKQKEDGKVLKLWEKGNGDETREQANSIELELWSFHAQEQGDFFEQLCDTYSEQHPEIRIKYVSVPYEQYVDTYLKIAFAMGKGPDIFVTAPGGLRSLENSGIVLELDKYLTEEQKADFRKAKLDACSIDGKLYAVPFETELIGLFYDRKLFQEYDIAPPETWDELVAAADMLTTEDRAGLALETAEGPANYYFYPFLWMTGANVFTDDLEHSMLDHPGTAKALQLYHDLQANGSLDMTSTRIGSDLSPLLEGKAAMQISGTWVVEAVNASSLGRDIGVVPLPVMEKGDEPVNCGGGWLFAVSSKSEYAEEAAQFLVDTWIRDDTASINWCTSVKFAYPVRETVFRQVENTLHDGLKDVFTTDIFGTELPELQCTDEQGVIISQMISNALYRMDGASAARIGHEQMEELLQSKDKE